jgi:hypothetical protein
MSKQASTYSPKIDANVTIQVNGIRILIAGLIWGMLFPGGWLALMLLTAFFAEQQMDWLNILFALPGIGISGFSMPVTFLILTLILDFLLAPFNKIKILKFLLGLFLPSADVATALVMIVADPVLHILWRIHPSLIPVKEYKWIMFCPYVRVEVPAGGVLSEDKHK